MRRRCTHPKWETTGVRFKEPTQQLKSFNNMDDDLLLAFLYGLSTITQRCTVCNWVSAENVPGRVILPEGALL